MEEHFETEKYIIIVGIHQKARKVVQKQIIQNI